MNRSDIRKDITGQRFGRLQVLWPVARTKNRGYHWIAQCDDGHIVCASGILLRSGHTQSCGCLRKDTAGRNAVRTHGQSGSPEYQCYFDAERRCNNPGHPAFCNYGARGIEFRFATFNQFLAVLGKRPLGMVLDRIDNDGHYEPGNVRWATMSESNLNRRMPWAKKVAV